MPLFLKREPPSWKRDLTLDEMETFIFEKPGIKRDFVTYLTRAPEQGECADLTWRKKPKSIKPSRAVDPVPIPGQDIQFRNTFPNTIMTSPTISLSFTAKMFQHYPAHTPRHIQCIADVSIPIRARIADYGDGLYKSDCLALSNIRPFTSRIPTSICDHPAQSEQWLAQLIHYHPTLFRSIKMFIKRQTYFIW